MLKLQAVELVFCFQAINNINDLTHAEAENTGFSAGICPLSLRLGGELYTQSEEGKNAYFFGPFQDEIQLAGHLKDKKTFESHFCCIQAKIDELFILVSIADKAGIPVVKH